MREKVYKFLNKIYGILMFVGFFGGFIPFVVFMIALVVGGEWGQNISLFLYEKYYPVIFAIASISILVGVIAMYVNKKEGFSVNELNKK